MTTRRDFFRALPGVAAVAAAVPAMAAPGYSRWFMWFGDGVEHSYDIENLDAWPTTHLVWGDQITFTINGYGPCDD